MHDALQVRYSIGLNKCTGRMGCILNYPKSEFTCNRMNLMEGCRSTGKETGEISTGHGQWAGSIDSSSEVSESRQISPVSGFTSQNLTSAPWYLKAFAVAEKVTAGTMPIVCELTPAPQYDKCNAAVPLEQAIACWTSNLSFRESSNAFTSGPCVGNQIEAHAKLHACLHL